MMGGLTMLVEAASTTTTRIDNDLKDGIRDGVWMGFR